MSFPSPGDVPGPGIEPRSPALRADALPSEQPGNPIYHANGDQKKAGVEILISDKIDFETKAEKRGKEGHYIMIKGLIQEDITIINIYAPNIGAPQNVRQMLTNMKGEINSNIIIVGDFNTPLTPMDRSTK